MYVTIVMLACLGPLGEAPPLKPRIADNQVGAVMISMEGNCPVGSQMHIHIMPRHMPPGSFVLPPGFGPLPSALAPLAAPPLVVAPEVGFRDPGPNHGEFLPTGSGVVFKR